MPLDKELGETLWSYASKPRKKNSPYVFLNRLGNPYTIRNLCSLFRKYADACHLDKGVSFRDLRTSGVLNLFDEKTEQEVGDVANLRRARLRQYATAKSRAI